MNGSSAPLEPPAEKTQGEVICLCLEGGLGKVECVCGGGVERPVAGLLQPKGLLLSPMNSILKSIKTEA